MSNNVQPLHPLVNEPRVLTVSPPVVDSPPVHLSQLQELQLNVLCLRENLAEMEMFAREKKPSEMSPLELSIVSKTLPPHLKNLSHPFAPFLSGCLAEMGAGIRRLDSTSLDKDIPQLLNTIVKFCWDIFEISQSRGFDDAEFQTYLQVGRSICSQFGKSNLNIIRVFSQSLDTFRAGWNLTTGQSMQRLWDKWRPATASSLDRLELLSKLRDVCADFDQAFLKTPLSHARLGLLRDSLVAAQTSVLLGADAASLASVCTLSKPRISPLLTDIRSLPSRSTMSKCKSKACDQLRALTSPLSLRRYVNITIFAVSSPNPLLRYNCLQDARRPPGTFPIWEVLSPRCFRAFLALQDSKIRPPRRSQLAEACVCHCCKNLPRLATLR